MKKYIDLKLLGIQPRVSQKGAPTVGYSFTHIGTSTTTPLLLFVGDMVIRPEAFEDLEAGDQVVQIGSGTSGVGAGMASNNRTAYFQPYITYKGKGRVTEFAHELLFFEVREEDRPEAIQEPLFIAYEILDHSEEIPNFKELKIWNFKTHSPWLFRPVFTKFKAE